MRPSYRGGPLGPPPHNAMTGVRAKLIVIDDPLSKHAVLTDDWWARESANADNPGSRRSLTIRKRPYDEAFLKRP